MLICIDFVYVYQFPSFPALSYFPFSNKKHTHTQKKWSHHFRSRSPRLEALFCLSFSLSVLLKLPLWFLWHVSILWTVGGDGVSQSKPQPATLNWVSPTMEGSQTSVWIGDANVWPTFLQIPAKKTTTTWVSRDAKFSLRENRQRVGSLAQVTCYGWWLWVDYWWSGRCYCGGSLELSEKEAGKA